MLIYWSGLGELQWAKRIEKIVSEMGHLVHIYHGKPGEITEYESELTLSFPTENDLIHFENSFQPTLILELNPCPTSKYPTNRVLFLHSIQGAKTTLIEPDIKRYQAIVCPDSVKNFLKRIKPELNLITGYPTHHFKEFKALTPNGIFYCGFLRHDKKRGHGEQKKALEYLANFGALRLYGMKKDWADFKNSYMGFLNFEADSIYKTIQDSGVCLVLHSNLHYDNGIPTARIFEAAASSSFIIADSHPFVEKHFKDSVLYVDRDADGKKLGLQIMRHFMWIKKNPEKALEKAKNAHAIFAKNFTLESFLEKLFSNVLKKDRVLNDES